MYLFTINKSLEWFNLILIRNCIGIYIINLLQKQGPGYNNIKILILKRTFFLQNNE